MHSAHNIKILFCSFVLDVINGVIYVAALLIVMRKN